MHAHAYRPALEPKVIADRPIDRPPAALDEIFDMIEALDQHVSEQAQTLLDRYAADTETVAWIRSVMALTYRLHLKSIPARCSTIRAHPLAK